VKGEIEVVLILVPHPVAHHLEDKRGDNRICLAVSWDPIGPKIDYCRQLSIVFDSRILRVESSLDLPGKLEAYDVAGFSPQPGR